jgi:hypothetical protein
MVSMGNGFITKKWKKITSCAYVNMGSFATDLKFISLPKAVSQILPHVQESLLLYRLQSCLFKAYMVLKLQ